MSHQDVKIDLKTSDKNRPIIGVDNPVNITNVEIIRSPRKNESKEQHQRKLTSPKQKKVPQQQVLHSSLQNNDVGLDIFANKDKQREYPADNVSEYSIVSEVDSEVYEEQNNRPPSNYSPRATYIDPREIEKEKQDTLFHLNRMERAGMKLTKKFTMRSDLDEMKAELASLKKQKQIDGGLGVAQNILVSLIAGVEFLNNKFDPIDLKLDGWSNTIRDNIADYDEIFIELIEKYSGKTQIAPELRLIFNIAMSGVMCHVMNKMVKDKIPNIINSMTSDPNVVNSFKNAMSGQFGQNSGGPPAGPGQSTQPPPNTQQNMSAPDLSQFFPGMVPNNPVPDMVPENTRYVSDSDSDSDRFSVVSASESESSVDENIKNVKISEENKPRRRGRKSKLGGKTINLS